MDEAMNHYHFSLPWFGGEVWVTDTIISFWVISAALILIAVAVRIMLPRFKERPRGIQNVIEIAVEGIDGMVSDSMSPRHAGLGGWFFGVIAVLMLCNMCGMFGLRPPTADLAFTAAFAVTSFFLIHFLGITRQPKHYFKEYVAPIWLLLPVHLVSEIAVPLSLSLRLFGNILGGFIIVELMYTLLPVWLHVAVPAPFHFYFDVFAAVLQAYIFCMLTMTFIKNKTVVEH